MGDDSGRGIFYGLLVITGLAIAWIYFEPLSDSYTGYYKTCKFDEREKEEEEGVGLGSFESAFWKCTTPVNKWKEVTAIKFTPNINTRTVVYTIGDSIKELRNCTILDRKNFRCPLERRKSYQVSMKDGKLTRFGSDFSYQVLSKFDAWKLKYENWVNENWANDQ